MKILHNKHRNIMAKIDIIRPKKVKESIIPMNIKIEKTVM